MTLDEFYDKWHKELDDRLFYSGDPDPGGTRLLKEVMQDMEEVKKALRNEVK